MGVRVSMLSLLLGKTVYQKQNNWSRNFLKYLEINYCSTVCIKKINHGITSTASRSAVGPLRMQMQKYHTDLKLSLSLQIIII